jgi:hypothetical protein
MMLPSAALPDSEFVSVVQDIPGGRIVDLQTPAMTGQASSMRIADSVGMKPFDRPVSAEGPGMSSVQFSATPSDSVRVTQRAGKRPDTGLESLPKPVRQYVPVAWAQRDEARVLNSRKSGSPDEGACTLDSGHTAKQPPGEKTPATKGHKKQWHMPYPEPVSSSSLPSSMASSSLKSSEAALASAAHAIVSRNVARYKSGRGSASKRRKQEHHLVLEAPTGLDAFDEGVLQDAASALLQESEHLIVKYGHEGVFSSDFADLIRVVAAEAGYDLCLHSKVTISDASNMALLFPLCFSQFLCCDKIPSVLKMTCKM